MGDHSVAAVARRMAMDDYGVPRTPMGTPMGMPRNAVVTHGNSMFARGKPW